MLTHPASAIWAAAVQKRLRALHRDPLDRLRAERHGSVVLSSVRLVELREHRPSGSDAREGDRRLVHAPLVLQVRLLWRATQDQRGIEAAYFGAVVSITHDQPMKIMSIPTSVPITQTAAPGNCRQMKTRSNSVTTPLRSSQPRCGR
jgi:hypothetical protein